jgi:hypothetical protein
MKPIKTVTENSKLYNIYLINSDELKDKEKFFIDFMKKYIIFNNELNKKYICIDCEFNSKKIALIQINFEGETNDNESNIFIIDPKILSKLCLDILRDDILCNSKIGKIFHGADSLDIPYFFYEFFESDKKKIIKFMSTFVDTRFLCEYISASSGEQNVCNVYDLLEKYNIMTHEKRIYLNENEEKMGKLYDIFIDIDALSIELINYSFYDVIYLKYLYKRMIHKIKKEYVYVNEMVRIVFLDKRDILNFVDKEKVNTYNNNYIVIGMGKIKRLNEMIEDNKIFKNKIFNTLYSVNYFKKNLNMMLKNIIYGKLVRREKVYETKSKIQKNELLYNPLFDKLKENKFNNIYNLIIYLDI